MKFSKKKIDTINGKEVFLIKFENDNRYLIEFYNFGGYFHSIKIPIRNNANDAEDVLLGYSNFDYYKKDKIYLNAIIGRVCGRIASSQFNINNHNYLLFPNEKPHHLHGGKQGFNKKNWVVEKIIKKKNILKCVLFYKSKHMEEGYPGNLKCRIVYSFDNNNCLTININAESDHDTIVNITNHNYWNFHGHKNNYQSVLQHFVKINGKYYCQTDKKLIPTGKFECVDKKAKYNFLKLKKINGNILKNGGIDKCYKISNFHHKIKEVARVFSKLTKMGMIMYSDQQGLQFYTGNMMKHRYSGKYNRKYGNQYGLCFEPQILPKTINENNFTSLILRKGEKYSSSIVIKFRNDFN